MKKIVLILTFVVLGFQAKSQVLFPPIFSGTISGGLEFGLRGVLLTGQE